MKSLRLDEKHRQNSSAGIIMIMTAIFPLLMMWISAERSNADYCVEYGEYSDIAPPATENIEGEISGIAINLWKCDDKILGLFAEYCGLPADPPTGKLDIIKYDSTSENLAFKVNISLGAISGTDSNRINYSRDTYFFTGKFKVKKSIDGTLKSSSEKTVRSPSRRLELKYNARHSSRKNNKIQILKTDLEKTISEILEFRGPKW